ncbi:MAG: hypothetical protein HY841_12340 [Bacteroidetes bacterium]|nr:hypothetical protein [Bacteroidota bacterium]
MTTKNLFHLVLIATTILPFSKTFSQDKSEFKPSGKLWGVAFGDYYFKQHADSASRGNVQYSGMSANSNSFEFRRIYLGYDYNISEKFSTELLVAYEGQTEPSGSRTVFLKAANVKWKNIFPKNDLILGLQSTPTFALLTDKVWEYRSVEKSLTDMRGVSKSVDAGIGVQGRLDSLGNFGYNLLAGNGNGSKPENDKFKKFYGDVYTKFLNKKIIVDLYSDYERTQLSPYDKNKTTFKLFVCYQTEKFATGIELFQQFHANYALYFIDSTYLSAAISDIGVSGISIFVRGAIIKDKFCFFIRGDIYDPDVYFNKDYVYQGDYSAYNTEMFSVLGLDYTPVKNVHIMPNVWYSSYQSRKKNASGLEKSDYDLVPRITIHYLFK